MVNLGHISSLNSRVGFYLGNSCVGFYRGRLGMQGTSVILGTRYAWNIDNEGDQVCLKHQSNWGLDMPGTLFDGD